MDVQDQVVARRFVLVDEQGTPAAYLTGSKDGLMGLHIAGTESKTPLVAIGVNPDEGTPYIIVRRHGQRGTKSRGQVYISVLENGQAAIRLEDADGTYRIITTD
jgi:hypothetical protein